MGHIKDRIEFPLFLGVVLGLISSVLIVIEAYMSAIVFLSSGILILLIIICEVLDE